MLFVCQEKKGYNIYMRKLFLSLLGIIFCLQISASGFKSLDAINSVNWAKYMDALSGYAYESRGGLHFSPSDMYLLYAVIPKGTPVTINGYNLRKKLPFFPDKIAYLSDRIRNSEEMGKLKNTFAINKTELIAYPSLNLLIIMVNGDPFAKIFVQAGPPETYLAAIDVQKNKPIVWDIALSTPTDIGKYKIFDVSDHYSNSSYYAGRYFGKYALLWGKDSKIRNSQMGYSTEELVLDQISLAKTLVYLLTVPGGDDFDSCSAKNDALSFYKELNDFIASKGAIVPSGIDPALFSYYKLYNGWELNNTDRALMDERVIKAFLEYQENRLPRQQQKRWEALGLYYYVQTNSWLIDKQAEWYRKIKNDWEFFGPLRMQLREDFDQMGILSLENRQNTLEKWINERQALEIVVPPSQAKYVQPLTFSGFFKPKEEISIFNQRESAIMLAELKRVVSGETNGLDLSIVNELNKYNFGVLLNDILGDLYRSHGCLHVSPRNMILLYNVLPLGSRMTVLGYSSQISSEALTQIPYLADLINFKEDLDKLKVQLSAKSDVEIYVYPTTGDWVLYLKGKPFARLQVKGGPQEKFYLVQDRDKNGKPIFESNLAFPTTPGTFYIYKKTDHYISNLYYPITIIPMGAEIVRSKDKWVFKQQNGSWKEVSDVIKDDLALPPEKRKYNYYATTVNSSGETTSLRWGSHPFGEFAIQTTTNYKTPWPELIHSSGDLMMEERQLIKDMLKVMTAPQDQLDECILSNENFTLYKACNDFVNNPNLADLVSLSESAAFRLYNNLPLTKEEYDSLPKDIIIAYMLQRGVPLNDEEIQILVSEGIASTSKGKLIVNKEKILGLLFDNYQYVVAINKYAHHYEVLKTHWKELSAMRYALLKDFNNFVLNDPAVFHAFMRELMLKRTRLEKLTQENSLQILNDIVQEKSLEK